MASSSVGVIVFYQPSTGQAGAGYICTMTDNIATVNNETLEIARQAVDGTNNVTTSSSPLTSAMAAGLDYAFLASADGTNVGCSSTAGEPASITSADSTFTSGGVALRTNRVAASYRYVVVYVPST